MEPSVSLDAPGEARHGQRCHRIIGISGLMRCNRTTSSQGNPLKERGGGLPPILAKDRWISRLFFKKASISSNHNTAVLDGHLIPGKTGF